MTKTLRKPMGSLPFDGIEDLHFPEAHHKLVYRFFIVFSRFECALKRSGFHKKSKDGSDVTLEVDWDGFSSAYKDTQSPSVIPRLREAWAYFLARPPCKQIVQDGSIIWSERRFWTTEPELTWLLDHVRIIRNNLFHGGKYPYNPDPDPARDSTLLEHTLVIIEVCSEFNENVSYYMRTAN